MPVMLKGIKRNRKHSKHHHNSITVMAARNTLNVFLTGITVMEL